MFKFKNLARIRPLARLAIYGGIIFAVVGGTLLFAILRGPTQGKLLYYQYRVANAQPSAGQVVYRFLPTLLEASDPGRFFGIPLNAKSRATSESPGGRPAGDEDNCALLPPHVVPAGGAGESADLDMYNRYLNFALTDDMQVLFAHGLTSATGGKRIVIVEYGPDPRPVRQRMAFEILVIEPATLSAAPRIIVHQRIAADDLHLAYLRTTCYAGEFDERDPASFHLAIEQGGGRRLLTGTLDASGHRVDLREDAASIASK